MQIQSVSNIAPLLGTSSATETKTSGASFNDILNNAMQDARETEATNDANTLALLAGENTDIHTATTEAKKAELALNLAIQIRNKVIDAYNEVMRMQV